MSLTVLLTRDRYQPAPGRCTLGRVVFAGRGFDSIEAQADFLFPAATYRVEPRISDAFGAHWVLVNQNAGAYSDASKGALFLLRAGDRACDLFNAVGIGKSRHRTPDGDWVVRNSRSAINELRTLLNGSLDVTLTIK